MAIPGYASGVANDSSEVETVVDFRQQKSDLIQQKKELNRQLREVTRAKYRGQQEVAIHWGVQSHWSYVMSELILNDYNEADAHRSYTIPPFNVGVFSVDYHYRFNGYFWLGATASYGCYSKPMSDPRERMRTSVFHYVRASVDCRFMYLNNEYVQLYSSVGLGMSLWVKDKLYIRNDKEFRNREVAIIPVMPLMPDVTLLGVSFGKDVYGMVEIGILSRSNVNIGLGYRF